MQQTRSLSQTDPQKAPCREACNTPFIAVLSERHAGIEQTQMTDRRLGGIVCLFGTLGTRLNSQAPPGRRMGVAGHEAWSYAAGRRQDVGPLI